MSRFDELEKLKESMGKGQPQQPKKSKVAKEPEAEKAAEEAAEESKPKRKKKVVEQE